MSYAFKEDGTAFIGKSGSGRIYLDGINSRIYSDTYYNGTQLWMSKENGLYSYYGTNSQGLTFATTDNPNTVPEDAEVVITDTSMLDYYTTLATLKDTNAVWYKEGNTYYTTDATILKY